MSHVCTSERGSFWLRFRKVGALTLACLLLSACTTPTWIDDSSWWAWLPFGAREPSPGVSPTTPLPPVDALQFIIWPVAPAEEEFLRTQLDAFTSQNPGTPIQLVVAADYDRRLTAPADDEAEADLFLATGFNMPRLIAENLLGPLPADDASLATVAPRLRAGFGVGDRAFCRPRDVHTLAVAYNPELFTRAAISFPDASWTWETFSAAAAGVTDQDFFIFGLTLNPDFSRMAVFMLQAGGGWMNPTTGLSQLTGPPSQQGMEFFIEQFRAGHAVYDTTLDSIWPGEAFGRGSAGMTVEGSWLLPFLAQEFPRLDYATVELPQGPAGRATLAFTTCLGVNPNSPHYARAHALAEFLTRPDIAIEWRSHHGGMPVVPDEIVAWQSVDPKRVPFAAAVEYATVWQLPLGWEELPDAATPLLRSAIAQDIDVPTLAQRLESIVQPE